MHFENKSKIKDTLKRQHIPQPIIISGVEIFSKLRINIKQITNTECKYT